MITASAGRVITGTACALCTVSIYQALANPGAAAGGGDYLGTTTSTAVGCGAKCCRLV